MKQMRKKHSAISIVNYWVSWEKREKKSPPWGDWDWNEPACMAGGWWDQSCDMKSTNAQRWASSGLEKCHVTPCYLTQDDDISNMVLMCHGCHSDQPDSLDARVTYDYMRQRSIWDCLGAQGERAQMLQKLLEA